jgi:O-antigen/teichoic acid export membrane protein
VFQKFRNLFKQSALYGLGNLLSQGLAFLLIPLYTRVLTTEDYGTLGVVNSVIAVLNIFLAAGIGNSILRFYYDYKDEDERRNYLGTTLFTLLGFSLVGALLVDLLGPYVLGRFIQSVPYAPYIRLGIWISFVTNLAIFPLAVTRAQERPGAFISFTVSGFLVNSAAIILFVVVLTQGALGSLRGRLIGSGLIAIPYLIFTVRNIHFRFSSRMARSILAFSLPLVPSLLGTWALNVSDRLILQEYVPMGDLGLYDLGYRIALVMALLSGAINNAWIPVYFREAQSPQGHKVITRFTTYIAMLMTFIGLGLALLSKEAIAIMSNPAYHSAYVIVPPVVLGYWFVALNTTFNKALMLSKKTYYLPVATLLAAAANIALNLWLVPRYGIMAAAYNTAIGYLALLCIVFFISNRVYPIQYEYKRILIPLALGLAIYALGSRIDVQPVIVAILLKCLLLSAFPAALWVLRILHPEEISGLLRVWRGLARRNPFVNPGSRP